MQHAQEAIEIFPWQLTPIVAAAIGEPAIELDGWKAEPLSGGFEAGNRVLRVSGKANASGKAGAPGDGRPWSLVLKIVSCTPEAETDPQGMRYWQREALAYQSGLLADLPCGMVAPRCYAARQEAGGEYWLWLEEVQDGLGKPWPLNRYREIARCLGCSNGIYLAGLAESGWRGDPDLVRFSSQAAIFYRYLFGAILGEGWYGLQDERNHPRMAAMFGVPDVGIVCDFFGSINQVYRQAYEDASRLLMRV